MKSCATGQRVRFFKVMIPTGLRVVGNSTGKRLSAELLAENCNTELGMIVRKRPVASSALRTGTVDVIIVVGGRSSPRSRKAWAMTEPDRLSGGGSVHGSRINSASSILRRRVHELSAAATTTS